MRLRVNDRVGDAREAASTPASDWLHHNRMRYYDPDAGQYISRDPLGLRAGLRVYGYVGDPGIASDPLGLSPQAGGGCGAE